METTMKTIEKPAAGSRLAFVDNIRWLMIIMVVIMHTCVTYSGLGSWFYMEKTAVDIPSTLTFAFYQSFSQAFFMGILFFIAATFVPKAYDRKGFGRFVLDRVIRLGAPAAVFMFILNPLIMIVMGLFHGETLTWGILAGGYVRYIASLEVLSGSGPLWFALALLVFSIVYALARLIGGAFGRKPEAHSANGNGRAMRRLSHGTVLAVMAIMAAGTFLVRLVQPAGTSWLNMQLGNFTQYAILFLAGLWIGRHNLLQAIPTRVGMTWLKLSLAAGVPAWFLLLGFGGALSGNVDAFGGGLRWQAAAFAVWESFFAVGFSLGLIVLFRERVNVRTPLSGFLSSNCFGVYCFHAPILVAISMAAMAMVIHPLAKTALVGLAAIVVSYLFAALVQKTPVLRKLFS